MKHYEQRLQIDLDHIKSQVVMVADMVQIALKNAMEALSSNDKQLAYNTIIGDNPINRKIREIDKICYNFIATHLPSASPLRMVSSVFKINIELERLGDYAVTISREAILIEKSDNKKLLDMLQLISAQCFEMLNFAVQAFAELDVNLAKKTMEVAKTVEISFEELIEIIVKQGDEHNYPTKKLLGYFVIANMLERTSDQAKNICEEINFAVTGQTKAKKQLKYLFIDNNHSVSLIAKLIANKYFLSSGFYDSAGINVKSNHDENLTSFVNNNGLGLNLGKPIDLKSIENIDQYDFIISIGKVENKSIIPNFYTIYFDWMADINTEESNLDFKSIYQELSIKIKDLIETVRGKESV